MILHRRGGADNFDAQHERGLAPAALVLLCRWCREMREAHFSTPPA